LGLASTEGLGVTCAQRLSHEDPTKAFFLSALVLDIATFAYRAMFSAIFSFVYR